MTPDPAPIPIRFGLLPRVLRTARAESARIDSDPLLKEVLQREFDIGRRIAWVGRYTAVAIIAVLVAYLSSHWTVVYYESLLLVVLGIGWLRRRYGRVGRSRVELALILADILVLMVVVLGKNPFDPNDMPTAFGYRYGNFIYFFLVLALSTLSQSWVTVWTMGVTVAVIWIGAAMAVVQFGYQVPELSAAALAAVGGNPGLQAFVDPNNAQFNLRVQEAVVLLIVTAALTLKGWRTNQLLIRQAELAAERANLSRYFPPTMVDVLASKVAPLSGPRTHDVAVLFCDLVGFTRMVETVPNDRIIDLLRRYYAAIERAIFENDGTLDKYLGDGVMATFGTPEPQPDDAARALRAARQIVVSIDAMEVPPGTPRPLVSVGVHFGPATVGDVGPPRRLEFAVIGDTVNVASRLETITRDLGCRIVASDAVIARARASAKAGGTVEEGSAQPFVERPGVMLRGRAAPIDVWICGGVGDDARKGTAPDAEASPA